MIFCMSWHNITSLFTSYTISVDDMNFGALSTPLQSKVASLRILTFWMRALQIGCRNYIVMLKLAPNNNDDAQSIDIYIYMCACVCTCMFMCVCVCVTTGARLTLRWRQNGPDSVSNHQPHHCLLNRLFRRRSKKTSKPRVAGLCVWNSPGTAYMRRRSNHHWSR